MFVVRSDSYMSFLCYIAAIFSGVHFVNNIQPDTPMRQYSTWFATTGTAKSTLMAWNQSAATTKQGNLHHIDYYMPVSVVHCFIVVMLSVTNMSCVLFTCMHKLWGALYIFCTQICTCLCICFWNRHVAYIKHFSSQHYFYRIPYSIKKRTVCL